VSTARKNRRKGSKRPYFPSSSRRPFDQGKSSHTVLEGGPGNEARRRRKWNGPLLTQASSRKISSGRRNVRQSPEEFSLEAARKLEKKGRKGDPMKKGGSGGREKKSERGREKSYHGLPRFSSEGAGQKPCSAGSWRTETKPRNPGEGKGPGRERRKSRATCDPE